MRITEIHFEGPTQNFATARRKRGSWSFEVEIITPTGTPTRKHKVQANDHDEVWLMAEDLHTALEGREGTRAELQKYFAPLKLLSDL